MNNTTKFENLAVNSLENKDFWFYDEYSEIPMSLWPKMGQVSTSEDQLDAISYCKNTTKEFQCNSCHKLTDEYCSDCEMCTDCVDEHLPEVCGNCLIDSGYGKGEL